MCQQELSWCVLALFRRSTNHQDRQGSEVVYLKTKKPDGPARGVNIVAHPAPLFSVFHLMFVAPGRFKGFGLRLAIKRVQQDIQTHRCVTIQVFRCGTEQLVARLLVTNSGTRPVISLLSNPSKRNCQLSPTTTATIPNSGNPTAHPIQTANTKNLNIYTIKVTHRFFHSCG